jgi:hypothetical protein
VITRDDLRELSPSGCLRFPRARGVVVRSVRRADVPWLIAAGLSPEKIGRHYHWMQAPLQLYVAPTRALLGPRGPAAIVELDGRRAGYVGRNPLSGHLEYFLQPWAQECGAEATVLREFLVKHRRNDRERRLVIERGDVRALLAVEGALRRLGWVERCDYRVIEGGATTAVWIKSTANG